MLGNTHFNVAHWARRHIRRCDSGGIVRALPDARAMRLSAGRLVEIGLKVTAKEIVVICLPKSIGSPADLNGTWRPYSTSTPDPLSRGAGWRVALWLAPLYSADRDWLTPPTGYPPRGHTSTFGWLAHAGEEVMSKARPGMSYWAAV